jgi:hypothetical protein
MPGRVPDYRIPLMGGGDQQQGDDYGSGMLRTLGGLMQLRQYRQQMDLRQRALEDDRAIRTTLQRYDQPEKAIDDLYHQGLYGAAETLSKSIYERRKSELEDSKARNDEVTNSLETMGQILNGVHDDQSLTVARPALLGLARRALPGADVENLIPKTHDVNAIDSLRKMGMKTSEAAKVDQDAINNTDRAYRMMFIDRPKAKADRDKAQREAFAEFRKIAAVGLGHTSNETQWRDTMTGYHDSGFPDQVLREFGIWEGPKSAARALNMGLTPMEGQTAEHQAAMDLTAAERADTYDESVDARIAGRTGTGAAGGPAVRGLTPNAISEAKTARKKANDLLNDEIKAQMQSWQTATRGGEPPTQAEINSANRQWAQRKLEDENSFRDIVGWPSVDQAIAIHSRPGGDKEKLKLAQQVRDRLTRPVVKGIVDGSVVGNTFDEAEPAGGAAPAPPPASRPVVSQPITASDPTADILAARPPDLSTPQARQQWLLKLAEMKATVADPKWKIVIDREIDRVTNLR